MGIWICIVDLVFDFKEFRVCYGNWKFVVWIERRGVICVSIIISNMEVNDNFDKKNFGGELKDKMKIVRLEMGKVFK